VAQQEEQLPLSWVPRVVPRRFGKVLPGEACACRYVARATGVLLDPIYTLAGWEVRA
jgi:1-aminocyclopropane-1-carboxylate deaminase/D-cysteine desulfhydrase-like pyridoxal-dependent ACC family enzyme